MKQERFSRGSKFEKLLNYSRVIVDGDQVFVAGCSGFDYDTLEIADNVTDQAEKTFENIKWCLAQADATLADLVRIRIVVASHSDYPAAVKVISKYCEGVYPVNTTWIADIPVPECKIEIEVTAIKNRC